MSKIICIDCSVISHKCIFSYGNMLKLRNQGLIEFVPNPDYAYFKTILSMLRKVGVDKEDKVMMVLDAGHSWRKAFYPEYKAGRKEMRDKREEIDWKKCYGFIKDINEWLSQVTNWQFVKIPDFMDYQSLKQTEQGIKLIEPSATAFEPTQLFGIEADDIMAVMPHVFTEEEIVIVSIDEDLSQLCHYPNVKIFSPNVKYNALKGGYKYIEDGMAICAKKARLGDKSDNILKELPFDLKEFLVNLIDVPEFVFNPVADVLYNLPEKEMDYNSLPFPKSLGNQKNFDEIYSKSHVVDYADCIQKTEKTKVKKETKKKAEAKAKRLKEKEESFR